MQEEMNSHAKLFRKLLEEYGITQKHLSDLSGMHQSKINRFVNGITDFTASDLFALLNVTPSYFQKAFWERQLGAVYSSIDTNQLSGAKSLLPLVEKLPPIEQIRLMKAIASSDLFEQNEKELARSA